MIFQFLSCTKKKWFKGAEGKIRKKEAEENDAWILDMYDAYLASRPNE